MAKKVRFWWALVMASLLNILGAPHAADGEHRSSAIARTQQRHDPDADSELPTRAQVEPQRTQIAPVQLSPIRQFFASPSPDDYDAPHRVAMQSHVWRGVGATTAQVEPSPDRLTMRTLRVTPAMAAKVTGRLWEMADMVKV